jgi:tetratricopeptide (TPR) repeat protein
MGTSQLDQVLRKSIPEEDLDISMRALMQDEIIWSALGSADFVEKLESGWPQATANISPTTLALFAVDPQVVSACYPDASLPAGILEEAMLGYESYRTQNYPVVSIRDAGLLAIAVFEKYRQANDWGKVLFEICDGNSKKGEDFLLKYWKTPLIVLSGMVDDPREFFQELYQAGSRNGVIKLFPHLILAQPKTVEEQAALAVGTLFSQPVEVQTAVLRHFHQNGNDDLLRAVSKGLLSRRLIHEVEENTVRALWQDPQKSLTEGNSLRELAIIAQYAGKYETAQKFLKENERILKAQLTGNMIQSAALKIDVGQSMEKDLEQIPAEMLENDEVSSEVACLGAEAISVKGIAKDIPAFDLNEAVKMHRAGNSDLAQDAARKAIQNWAGEDEARKIAMPMRAVNWQPGKVVDDLIEMGMWQEAASISRELLEDSPVSKPLLIQAALIAEKQGDLTKHISHLEKIILLDPADETHRRKLAKAYLQSEAWQSAFGAYQKLIRDFNSTDEGDLLGMAKSALKCGDYGMAQEFAQKVLTVHPGNSQAMAISGYAYHKQGNPDKAQTLLDRSLEINSADCEPWMLLAEMYAEAGETTKSVNTLRSAFTAHPESVEIKARLAKSLLDNGQSAEALTVLGEGHLTNNKESALLKLRAMKQLNLPELANVAEQLYADFPGDREIQKEYVKVQLAKGNRELARKILEPMVNANDSDLNLAYCDAVIGEDYHLAHAKKSGGNSDQTKAEAILHETLVDDPQNTYARMLLGESLIHQQKSEKAFEFLKNLLGDPDAQNSSWLDRIRAGFARSAALLERFDIALNTTQEVVEANPDWAGAAQDLAEIEAATGEIEEAVDAAVNVLEVAQNVVESVEWFADFMGDLGKTGEAEKILERFSKTHADKHPFLFKLAELKASRDEKVAACELVESIKPTLSKMKMDGELLQAARVFSKLDDADAAEQCLKLRSTDVNTNNPGSLLDLAGYQYGQGKYSDALGTIEQARGKFGDQRWIKLIQADTLHANREAQRALELLSELDAANDFLPEVENLEFAPSQWVPLLQPQASTDSLIRSLAFESGNYQEVLQNGDSSEDDPANMSVVIEAGYAAANTAPLQMWLKIEADDERVYRSALLAAQVAEILLDAGEIEKAAQIVKRGLELYAEDRVLLANASRYSTLIGDVNTAEALLDQILPQFPRTNASYSSAASVCAMRALLKAAAAANRWTEALECQQVLLQANQRNLALLQLSLQTLVQALEFAAFTENLGVRQHLDPSNENIQSIQKQLKSLIASLESQKNHFFDHWVARAKTILEPNQTNIRSLALNTPDDEDVAAMMLGLHRSGQTGTAVQLASKFDGQPKVMYALAYCLKDLEPDRAIETLKKDKKTALILPWSNLLAQSLYRKRGEYYLAINDVEEAVQWWPAEPEWHVIAAECWQDTGDLQNAINHLELAEKLLPEDGRMKYLLGKACLQAKETDRAIQTLETASKTAANHFETWETLAEAYYTTGDKESALKAAEKAGSINGFSTKPILLSAKINLDNGDAKKALELAQSACKHDEQDAESLVLLAKSWLANGNKLQALQVLEKVSHAKVPGIQTMIDQAKLVQEVNGAASARVILESLEEKYPENIEVLNMLSEAQLAGGDKVTAQATAQRSLKLQDGQPRIQHFIGRLDLEAGHLDQAIHHFSQAIAQGSQDVEIYLDLGEAYIQQRDFESAMDTLDRAIELAPTDIRPLMAEATLLRNGKDYAKAESRLRKASEIAPNDLNIRRQLGAVIALNLVHSSQEASSNI